VSYQQQNTNIRQDHNREASLNLAPAAEIESLQE
jgi:hypothetical protein